MIVLTPELAHLGIDAVFIPHPHEHESTEEVFARCLFLQKMM